jgi:hypothetical protein
MMNHREDMSLQEGWYGRVRPVMICFAIIRRGHIRMAVRTLLAREHGGHAPSTFQARIDQAHDHDATRIVHEENGQRGE